jgi:hypothetical protein
MFVVVFLICTLLVFYKLDYLSPARSKRSSLPLSPSSPTRTFFGLQPAPKTKKLNLAFVEDPLLATAIAHAPVQSEPPAVSTPSPVAVLSSSAPDQQRAHSSSISSITGRRDSLASPMFSPSAYTTKFDGKFLNSPLEQESYTNLDGVWDDAASVSSFTESTPEPHLITHARVYALAEKYQIAGLKSLARRKFAAQVALHHSSTEFPSAMLEVYESTVESDRGLRDVITQTFRRNPEIARRKDVCEVVRQSPELAYELFRMAWGLPINS